MNGAARRWLAGWLPGPWPGRLPRPFRAPALALLLASASPAPLWASSAAPSATETSVAGDRTSSITRSIIHSTTHSATPLLAELDELVQQGQDDPQRALARLAELAANPSHRSAARSLALARGLVAAAAGLPNELQAALAVLDALAVQTAQAVQTAPATSAAQAAPAAQAAQAAPAPDPLAGADATLVRAAAADARGDTTAAFNAATAALQGYTAACTPRLNCDHRARWQTLQLLARQDRRRGLNSAALDHALAAAELARAAGDGPRQALALAAAADLAGLHGDAAAEQRHITQARRLARADGEPLLRARLQLFETRWQRRLGDNEAARRAASHGLALARVGGSPRLEAAHLANLADAWVALGQPRLALQAIAEALPMVRRLGDGRTERVLVHNAALAHVGLGQTAAARREMDTVLAAYRDGGATADQALALREFGDAFAAAGDKRSALQLFHQERKLAAEIMAANRDSALAELRQRFDREAQQRRLEQLGRERTLVTAQLDNRAAMQKVWAAGAAVLLLAAVLVAQMYRRVRRLRRRLEDNHARLREQSHRDPLTGLHNRRGLHDSVAARGLVQRFEGALMLLDIDHFKRINDGHGHAAGDAVLVEVARRLSMAVREQDLVVRWGGEEFIVCMAGREMGPGSGTGSDAPGGTPGGTSGSTSGGTAGSTPGGTSSSTAGNTPGGTAGNTPDNTPDNTPGSSGAAQAQAHASALARRVLDAIGATPVALPGGGALRVTVSVGYACFPLPPARLPLALERAINLVDMAMYTAKNQGRNRAIGITSAAAIDGVELLALETHFDQAWREGRVQLLRLAGPEQGVAEADAGLAEAPAAALGA